MATETTVSSSGIACTRLVDVAGPEHSMGPFEESLSSKPLRLPDGVSSDNAKSTTRYESVEKNDS